MITFPNSEFNEALKATRVAAKTRSTALKELSAALATSLEQMFPKDEEFEFVCIDIKCLQMDRYQMVEVEVLCTGTYTKWCEDQESGDFIKGTPYVEISLGTDDRITLDADTVIIAVN